MKMQLLLVCLLVGQPVLAAAPPARKARPLPCSQKVPERTIWPQGTLLWGTGRKVAGQETSSVLVSVKLGHVRLGKTTLKGVRLEDGQLVAPPTVPNGLKGAIFQGKASDGQPVDVAVCGAEPSPGDASQVWYRIEVWNTVSESWDNPCVATTQVPSPQALAVRGVWDETGAHREVPRTFTFACENGAIAKCVEWGYKPWAKKDGQSLAPLHQACTRMARADYCGNGRSHTRDDNPIDMYDGRQVLTRTTESSAAWDVMRASFEAGWSEEGALCMAHTRDGRAVEEVLAECPGRFEAKTLDLGEGDHCTLLRKGARVESVLLRNHSYGQREQTPAKAVVP
jgi:hypothetical protein